MTYAFNRRTRLSNLKNPVILSGATLKAGRSRRTFAPIPAQYQFQMRRSLRSLRSVVMTCVFNRRTQLSNLKNPVILSEATLKAGRSRRTFAPIPAQYQFQMRRSLRSLRSVGMTYAFNRRTCLSNRKNGREGGILPPGLHGNTRSSTVIARPEGPWQSASPASHRLAWRWAPQETDSSVAYTPSE